MISALRKTRRRVSRWGKSTPNRRIFSAAFTVGSFGLFASLVMVVRELAIAQEFGRSDQVDAYFIAYLVPLTLMQVIVGSFGPALMPEYLKVRQHEGVPAGKRLFAACLSWASVVLLAVTGALAAGIDLWLPLLTSGFEHEKRVLTGKLFMLLLPSLCLSGIASLWTTALNAERRFVLGALTPAVVPLGAIVSLMVFAKEYGVEALAVGTLAGHALQCALLIPALQRRDIPVLPRWQRRNEQMASVVRQYLPAASGALLMSTTTFVNQGMAAMIDPGSVAALSYGNKVVNFVLGIGALALSSAVLPEFSRMTSESDWFGIRRTMKTYSALILIGGGVVALLLYVVSEPLVAAIFQRGAFGERDTSTVAQVQALYVLQIPFYLVGITLVRLIAALQLNYILLWGTVINVSANVVLNLLFIRWLGVAGIALSTSVVYLIAMIFFGLAVVRRLSTRISGEAQQVVITCAQKL